MTMPGVVSNIRVLSPTEAWAKVPMNIKAGVVDANLRSFSVNEMPGSGLFGYTTVTLEYSWHGDKLGVADGGEIALG